MLIQQKSKKYISNLINDESYHSEIVKTGIDDYLDYFIKNSNKQSILVNISKIGRKKDLDYFIENISKFDTCYKNDLLTQIAHNVYNELFKYGRLKDLSKMKEHKEVSYLFDFDSVTFPW